MLKISEYIEKEKSIFLKSDKYNNDHKNYFSNASADSIHCLNKITPYLKKGQKILEVGGGIHLLTGYIDHMNFDITSVEPGMFLDSIDNLRNEILLKKSLKVHTTTLEKFNTNEKFDFIFSMVTIVFSISVTIVMCSVFSFVDVVRFCP